ncbi:MAG: NADH-quinone oxidoreductase subunit J [Acidimicrobiia bacterium]|nr:NADH-quinone oxidoreductase subunit J [Acidimicrobiia bacterium]
MEAFVFFAAAAILLGGALGVVLARNTVHSALFLVGALIAVAVLFVQQQAHLLAAVQVIVYAGAVVVLFLFVIMLLGVDDYESLEETIPFQRPAGIVLGVAAVVAVIALAGNTWATGRPSVRGSLTGPASGFGNVEAVGRELFTTFLWPFELTAVLLVLAVVGGVVLARRSHPGSGDAPDASAPRSEGAE